MGQIISGSLTRYASLRQGELSLGFKSSRPEAPFPLTAVSYRKKRPASHNDFMMRITVDADSVTELRRVIIACCGDLVTYMRIKPVDHATRMKVWLCLHKTSVDPVMGNIMRTLPQAEFGHITPLLPV